MNNSNDKSNDKSNQKSNEQIRREFAAMADALARDTRPDGAVRRENARLRAIIEDQQADIDQLRAALGVQA